METVKKHKIIVVGLLTAGILGIVALIALASGEKTVGENATMEQALTIANQQTKACPTSCTKSCCKTENECKACPADCKKECCTAKNAEENVKSCPFRTPKSCCGKS